jgi:hypothetical protein
MRRILDQTRKAILAFLRRVLAWFDPAGSNDAIQVVVAEPEFDLGTGEPPKYAVKKSLSSGAELAIYRKLCEAIGTDYAVFTKVRLGDVLHLANEPADRKYHNNQIQCKHFDFLLCHTGTHQPLLAIELDDDSHLRFRSQQSDTFKGRVCKQAGLHLLRLHVQESYDQGRLTTLVHEALGQSG